MRVVSKAWTRAAQVVLVALVATTAAWLGNGATASAAPVTTAVGTYCSSNPANGLPNPLPQSFGIVADVTTDGPATISPNQSFSVSLATAANVDLHGALPGNPTTSWAHISKIGPAEVRFKAPANATYNGYTLGAPGNLTVSSVALVGGEIVVKTSTTITNTSTWTQAISFDTVNLNFTAGSSGTVTLQPGGTAAAPGVAMGNNIFLRADVVVDLGWTTTSPTATPPNPNPNQIAAPIPAASNCQAASLPTLYSGTIVAPSLTITSPLNGATFQQAPPASPQYPTVTCQNPPAGGTCQGRIDGGAWFPLPTTSNSLNATVGAHTFSARMVDASGTPVAGVATQTVNYTVDTATVVDQVPPTVTIAQPTDGAVFTVGQTPNPTFQYSCADPGGVLSTCVGQRASSINGPWTNTANNALIPLIALGGQPTHYVFRVTATDQAGNTTVKVVSYTVMPGPVQQNGGFNCTNGIKVVPIGSGTWNGNNCVPFTTNTAPPSSVIGNTFTWATKMGTQTFTGSTNTTITYTLKVTGATLSNPVVTTPGTNVSAPSVSLSGTSQVVLTMKNTASSFAPPGIAVTVTPTVGIGQNVTSQFVKVTAGNAGVNPTWIAATPVTNLTTTAIIGPPDNTPPIVNLTSPPHGSVWPLGTPIPVAYSCTDNVPTPTCVTTPANVANGSTLTPPIGTHTLAVTSVDAAGNTAFVQHTYYVVQQSSVISISGCTAVEATPCNLTVTVTPPSASAVTVSVTATPGTASASDFTAPAATVDIPANTASATVAVPTTDDALVEPTEDFTVTLSNPVGTNVALSATAASATGSITDWNTTNQCAARWPADLEWQVQWAIDNLPGSGGTVSGVIAAGFTYWQGTLAGTTSPLDPVYVASVPPAGTGNLTYPVTFTQAFYNSVIFPMMQLNGMSCDDVVTTALYLGVLVSFSGWSGSVVDDVIDEALVIGGVRRCSIEGKPCIDAETARSVPERAIRTRISEELSGSPPDSTRSTTADMAQKEA